MRLREIRWLEEGSRGVLASILSTSEQLKRQSQRSGFQMAGDRHGSSAADHSGLRRHHGDPRRPRFHRPPGIAEYQSARRNPFPFNPGPDCWRPWMIALPLTQQSNPHQVNSIRPFGSYYDPHLDGLLIAITLPRPDHVAHLPIYLQASSLNSFVRPSPPSLSWRTFQQCRGPVLPQQAARGAV